MKLLSILHTIFLSIILFSFKSTAQSKEATSWVDSVFNSLTEDQRIAQLLVVRSSGMDASGKPVVYDDKIDMLVEKYNIGAICAFQGTPLQHATMLNRIQAKAQTPIMVTIDAEWGLGMRFAGVQSFPNQLTMGAISDAESVYNVGKGIANQLRRMNIHVNYAPVVDINNNPNNPVIGLRSFGEDKYKVALLGTRIMEGMQDRGIMACAKHFPGHGDVAVDSHYDLPVINKTKEQLFDLELYPFQQIFKKGVGSVMVAHLYIPSIDTTANQATSLSYKNITELMRSEMGYNGLTFTDALEMKGVTKYYPDGEAAVQSLIAGNDMLCLPADVAQSITAIKAAISNQRLTWDQVNDKCKRVLYAKHDYVLGKTGKIDTTNLMNDLNSEVPEMRKTIAQKAITVLALKDDFFPIPTSTFITKDSITDTVTTIVQTGRKKKTALTQHSVQHRVKDVVNAQVAYIALGNNGSNELSKRMRNEFSADVFALPFSDTQSLSHFNVRNLKKYKKIIIGLHGIGRNPAKNFNVPIKAIDIINVIQSAYPQSILLTFGNPYINHHFSNSDNLVACYEDDAIFQSEAADWLLQKWDASGTLPVTVGKFAFGSGIVKKKDFEVVPPEVVGMNSDTLLAIDKIATEAINLKATPGCVVLVLRKGKLVFEKAYGNLSYSNPIPVSTNSIYDLASVTKIAATSVSIMKLVEDGKLDIKDPIVKYLPWVKGSDKANLTVENLLLHQAGLNAFIPFYKEVTDKKGSPLPELFTKTQTPGYQTPVSDKWYLRNDWPDSMLQRVKFSKVNNSELKYVYSDNDFILLGKIVEAISGLPLDEFARTQFYDPLEMQTTRYKAFNHFANSIIAPTEDEKIFRQGLIWGYVHDPGAAMFGNVAGHAGLFSNATDLAKIFQMLLNGGVYKGTTYLQKSTIDWFTSYQTPVSRRGLGFDKPEKDNDLQPADKAYPNKYSSKLTYGHTGFTGVCVWADPQYDLLYIFLSNRVNPIGGDNGKLSQLNIRSRIQDVIYQSIQSR